MGWFRKPAARNAAVAEAMAFLDSKEFRRSAGLNLDRRRQHSRLTEPPQIHYFRPNRRPSFRARPDSVGTLYCRYLWKSGSIDRLLTHPSARSRFHVALSVHDEAGYETCTKRTALITDTLVLSDDAAEEHTEDRGARRQVWGRSEDQPWTLSTVYERWIDHRFSEDVSVLRATPRLLGNWLVGAKPLVSSGAVWFLPHFYVSDPYYRHRESSRDQLFEATRPLDFLIRDGRAVEMSGVHPVKSRLVRPVVELEIPVVEGTSLRDFSDITVGEFDSYAAFRDFLRSRLLELDSAMTAVDSQVALTRIGLEIADEVRGMNAQLRQVRTRRAVQVTGAAIGTVSAVLLGVYGPAFQHVVATVGASAGLWGGITALAENSTRALREDKWYYVWALAKKAHPV